MLPFLIAGLAGGFLSGLFGVGGGLVMVPLLMWLAKVDQRKASATSLIAVIPAAITGAIGYGLGGRINFTIAAIMGVGAIVGAPIGTWLLRTLSLGWLRWLLIGMIVLSAIRMLTLIPSREDALTFTQEHYFYLVLIGLVMGVASGLFGIGGGIIIVPIMMAFFGVSDLTAKGTSLVAMIPGAIVGTYTNLRSGIVKVKEGLTVGFAAVVASYAGVSLAFLLPAHAASLIFGIFLLLLAARLTQQHLTAQRAAKK